MRNIVILHDQLYRKPLLLYNNALHEDLHTKKGDPIVVAVTCLPFPRNTAIELGTYRDLDTLFPNFSRFWHPFRVTCVLHPPLKKTYPFHRFFSHADVVVQPPTEVTAPPPPSPGIRHYSVSGRERVKNFRTWDIRLNYELSQIVTNY